MRILAAILFKSMDLDGNGSIDFEELIIGLTLATVDGKKLGARRLL